MQSIYLFFGKSINRWDLLLKFTGESEIVLKKLNPIRWSSRNISISAIKLRFVDTMKALTNIQLTSTKKDEQEEAGRIKRNIETFEFIKPRT